jgi:hypothetical protein
MSDVITGVIWAATQAVSKAAASRAEFAATGKTKHKGSVANMSLGGGASKALDDAVNKAVVAGLHFAVAAGTWSLYSLRRHIIYLSFGQVMTIAMLAISPLLLQRKPSPLVRRHSVTSGLTSLTMGAASMFLLLVCLS